MRAARQLAWTLIALGAVSVACGGGDGKGATQPGLDGGDSGGSDSAATGGSGGANSDGGTGGPVVKPIPASVKKVATELQVACERIDARSRECGALGSGETRCAALTAGWFNSDLGFRSEVDLSKLDAAALLRELGADELKCKADCAEAATCEDVLAELRDGACDGAPDFTGALDACRDACDDKFGGYACGDGTFVGDKAKCDGVADCANGNDEACSTDSYDCGGGVSVTRARPSDTPKWNLLCDGKVQCDATGKDEAGCDEEAFQCAAGEYVAFDDVCNGKDDCMAGSDEADCAEFDCGDGERIPARGVCDSDTNCKNHSDDLGCPGWFVCENGKAAVAGDQVCEIADLSAMELAASNPRKLYDCPDMSDEVGCARVVCE